MLMDVQTMLKILCVKLIILQVQSNKVSQIKMHVVNYLINGIRQRSPTISNSSEKLSFKVVLAELEE